MQAGKSLGAALAALFCLSGLSASSAFAADPVPAPTPPTPPSASVTLRVQSFLSAGKKVVGVPRQPVRVRGTVAPFSAGQQVQLDFFLKRKRVKQKTRPLVQTKAGGRYGYWFKPKRRGVYRVRATLVGGTVPAARKPAKRLYVVRSSAGPGARGTNVRALQRRLADLGYLTPVNGSYSGSTGRAVLAFRKVNGMSRSTYAGRAVFGKLARGGGGYKVRYPKLGKHAEFDWSRQVLVLARGAKPQIITHASSGKSSTPTVFGSFRFQRREPGTNSHGMYYSTYFIGGYAIHGYPSVPSYPASHGCIRIPIPSAKRVYGWIDLGDPIRVYR
jgi:L,D-transpeptidase catalytic domain/Putative peptidoglycan binding domain